MAALSSVPDETCVIFVYSEAKIESGSLFEQIQKHAKSFEFRPLAEWQPEIAANLVEQFAREINGHISSLAARRLVDLAGVNLRALNSEIQKIINCCGTQREITLADIENLVSPRNLGIYKFVGFLKNRDARQVMQAYRQLRSFGDDPVGILLAAVYAFRILFQVKVLSQLQSDPVKVAQRMAASLYMVKQAQKEARNFSVVELKNALQAMHTADCRIKNGYQPDAEIELLLAEICGARKQMTK